MNNCYVCGANLGIYSRGTALDKGEKYVLCSRCYWGVMSFHKSLHKISSLEELDKLEEKLDQKISSGKLKDRQVEAIKVCYEEKRKELKVQTQMLEQYEMIHNPAYKAAMEQTAERTEAEQFEQLKDHENRAEKQTGFVEERGRTHRDLSKITTADTLAGMTVQEYLGPVSVQQIVPVSTVEEEAEFSRIKQEVAFKLLSEAQKSGGAGVIGLKYSLTPMGTDRMLLMADGTSVK